MIIDKGAVHENADHLLAFMTWLRDNDLLVEPMESGPSLAMDVYEHLEGRLLTDDLTAEGQEVVGRVYSEFLEVWDQLGAAPLTWESYRDFVVPWLDEVAAAESVEDWEFNVHSRLAAGLSDLVAAHGLRPVKRHGLAWSRPAPGGWQTGFWLEVHPDQHASPFGGAFIVRVCGGRFAVDKTTSLAPPELRFTCWVGAEGRQAMHALNEAVWAKLPPITQWPTADAPLTPPRRAYTPADEPWMRFSEPSDIEAWLVFLRERIPGVLDDIDSHYAGMR